MISSKNKLRVANVMLGRKRGGIEQALIDYCEALQLRGADVTAITHHDAWVNNVLKQNNISFHSIGNWGGWDLLASHHMAKRLALNPPDAIIAHGNRAFDIARRAAGNIPLIAVAHNYNTRRFFKADAVFSPTKDIMAHLQKDGIASEHLFLIPNMARIPADFMQPTRPKNTVCIGSMGRFIKKKGFDVFIRALGILKQEGIDFRAVLGGDGEEKRALVTLSQREGIKDQMDFCGWVENKNAFFSSIDIFCLPSLHEPFGIVLLESFARKVPVVAANAEGPREIIIHGSDGLLVEKNNPIALAGALRQLIEDKDKARELADRAFLKLKIKYTLPKIGEQMMQALERVCAYRQAA